MSRLSSWSAAELAARLSGSGKQQAKKVGEEWKVCCPAHDDRTPSLFLRNVNGKLLWHCFGGCDAEDVRKAIEAVVGGEDPVKSDAPVEREKTENPRRTVYPVPADAHFTFDSFQHSTYGAPNRLWTYRLEDGTIAGWIARYDLEGGDKEVIPFVWSKHEHSGKEEPVMRSMPEPRPLYNLDKMAAHPDRPVLFCEGEKAADAAEKIFPDWIPTTLPGGGNAIRLVDLAPLAGRMVIIMADHDGPGYELALKLSLTVPDDTDLRMIDWPEEWPVDEGDEPRPYAIGKGDDAADHLERGWTTEMVRKAVARTGQPLVHRVGVMPAAPEPLEISHRR